MYSSVGPSAPKASVRLVLDVPYREDEWILPDEDVPESCPHRDTVRLLELILLAFVARTLRQARVAANLACRWDAARPMVGVDPDIALLDPAPPEAATLTSLRTWVPGHAPPRFAIEVVSSTNPSKDYEDAPAKYALLGTRELVVFDPEGRGPKAHGGPQVLQVWRRDPTAPIMTRVYAGAGPAHSEELGAWLFHAAENRLRIADDPAGQSLWLTAEEAEAKARHQAEADLQTSLRAAVEDVCELCAIPLDDTRRAHLASLDAAGLQALRARLKRDRAWPAD